LAKAISPKRSAEALAVPKADQVALDSPMVGIFYRSPKPGSPSFIEVGQYVSVGQIIGMIEAMKTFSNVEAEHSGTVVSFPAKDGELVQMGTTRGRSVKKGLKIGVCGEHGGDPESIDLFYRVGLDYVSCSPFRVPIARLAAAQAVLSSKGGAKTVTK